MAEALPAPRCGIRNGTVAPLHMHMFTDAEVVDYESESETDAVTDTAAATPIGPPFWLILGNDYVSKGAWFAPADVYGRKTMLLMKALLPFMFQASISDTCSLFFFLCANCSFPDMKPANKQFIQNVIKVIKQEIVDKPFLDFIYSAMVFGLLQKRVTFSEVTIWATIPSSQKEKSSRLKPLVDKISLLHGQEPLPEDLLIRITAVQKSRTYKSSNAESVTRHIDTIRINAKYLPLVQGGVVCIIDDFCTSGSTAEACRSLLLACGAAKVFVVAIGKFSKHEYNVQTMVLSEGSNLPTTDHRENLAWTQNKYTVGLERSNDPVEQLLQIWKESGREEV